MRSKHMADTNETKQECWVDQPYLDLTGCTIVSDGTDITVNNAALIGGRFLLRNGAKVQCHGQATLAENVFETNDPMALAVYSMDDQRTLLTGVVLKDLKEGA